MLKLAKLLALHHLHVTFLNVEFIHHSLQCFGDIEKISETYPTLQFKTIPDGLPENHPRSGENIMDALNLVNLNSKPLLKDILVSQNPRVTCLIGDGYYGSLTNDVADEVGIPVIHFRTVSACCFWSYFCVPDLFQSNQLPIRGDEDMDRIITGIPGMENMIRCRDLPSFCRENDLMKPIIPLESLVSQTHESLRASALILNTFEDLEGPVLSHISLQFPQVFSIGPLHAHLNTRIQESNNKTTMSQTLHSSTNSLLEVDRSCMAWLNSQPLKSVVYVSFGSITTITREKLLEIWYGLVNSKNRFLWVMRSDMVTGKEGEVQIPDELVEGTKERGFMVGWAPQVEVLEHKAIGGFLTHSGWNSTLESIVAGVPMICWPYFADQQINSRFVSEAWKLGLDMKDVCDRNVVEKMVNDVMIHKRDEFQRSAQRMAMLAHKSVSPGGSSNSNLDRLIQFIKSATLGKS
ncbi:unnamed protein product [Lupinus luteus]|uniref:Glycosyltransferase n=1 Tax=Lupinus luteus TaxID=3873 RepID=A0AAV1YC26_LUPLU